MYEDKRHTRLRLLGTIINVKNDYLNRVFLTYCIYFRFRGSYIFADLIMSEFAKVY